MSLMVIRVFFGIPLVFVVTFALPKGKKLDVCVERIEADSCKNPAYYGAYENKNEIDVEMDSVQFFDFQLPGSYTIDLGKITLKADLEFLVADVQLMLEVPGFGLLNANTDCDKDSHKVYVDGHASHYCRYCDICKIMKTVEPDLEDEEVLQFSSDNDRFENECTKLKQGNTYFFKKQIKLPTATRFEDKFENDVNPTVEDALRKGKGKIHARLRLLSKPVGGNGASNGSPDKQGCIVSCLNDPNTVCGPGCSSKTSLCFDLCKTPQNSGPSTGSAQEEIACMQSKGFVPTYNMAACYNVQFDYRGSEIPESSPSLCTEAANPCVSQPRYCCGCTQCIGKIDDCTLPCMNYNKQLCDSLLL